MKTTLSLLFLLLSLPASAKNCKVEGLDRVTLPEWVSCKDFRANFALAKRMVLAKGWATEEELEKVWGRAIVTVEDAEFVPCGAHPRAGGCTSRQGLVWLSQNGIGLFHELLHLLQDASVPGHDGWKERGWTRAAAIYERRCIDLNAY